MLRSLPVALAFLGTAPPAQSGPPSVLRFNASYHVGQYGTTIPLARSGQPRRLVSTRGQLVLRADGTQTATLTTREVFANPAADRTVTQALPGTWIVDADGTIELDYAPAMPGTDVRPHWITPDGSAMVGARSAAEPDGYLAIALRRSASGLSVGTARGSYAVVRVSHTFDASGGIAGSTASGTAVFDGLGRFTFNGQQESVRADGTSTTIPLTHSGTYAVAADGAFTLDGVDLGGISANGNVLFACSTSPREVALTVAIRTGAGLTMDGVVGTWGIAYHEYHAGTSVDRPLTSTGLGLADFTSRTNTTGDYVIDGTFAESDPTTLVSGPGTTRGALAIAGPSTLRADPGTPDQLDLAVSQDHGFVLGSKSIGVPEMFVGLRVCGGTRHFGAATPGTGGVAPGVGISGFPTLGNPSFGIQLYDGRGGAAGLLAVSIAASSGLPFLGGRLHLDPTFLADGFPVTLSGPPGVAGAGRGRLPFAVPSDPALAGFVLYWQLITLDPSGPAGFALSDGFALRFCR